jgi:4-diphosphocytidyl-2-C-methyl-D-erythritol kinase
MTALRLRAHAKINWTLEVLAKREDGYHEVRTIMQTIDLADTITLRDAEDVSLSISGESSALDGEPRERNLAYRAALLLRGEAKRGVRIELEKRIPIAVGLGGGSSDAAAVLRGLRTLWQLDVLDGELASMAAELGSDVSFFLECGTAIASGRGEQIESLPDTPEQHLVVAWPRMPSPLTPLPNGEGKSEFRRPENKTGRMYAALRPEHYSGGSETERLVERLRVGKPARDEDVYNVFERVLAEAAPDAASSIEAARQFGTPHLCGSGPALFFLPSPEEAAHAMENELRSETIVTRTIGAHDALAIEELT